LARHGRRDLRDHNDKRRDEKRETIRPPEHRFGTEAGPKNIWFRALAIRSGMFENCMRKFEDCVNSRGWKNVY
jgi:hypothetical protein